MNSNQNSNSGAIVLALVAIVIAIVACFLSVSASSDADPQAGASGSRFPNGISADSTSPSAGEVRGDDLTLDDDAVITDDLTVNGRAFTLTTSNTSTSTAIVGCYQTTATSTLTPIHLEFNTQSTTTINGASDGSVAWKYGACPI